MPETHPNIVIVFGDQWRAQAFGYAGDPNVRTPNLDRLSRQSVNFTHAVAGCPVCSPYRASLITGRYPHTHGVFLNDVCLSDDAVSLAQACAGAGYQTAYIGKWHLDGHGRRLFIPPERGQGFEFWRVMECTHAYNDSWYYGDDPTPRKWEGYDAFAQTHEAIRYLREERDPDRPFLLVLSWGPPHTPVHEVPEEYHRLYDPETLQLRPNVPETMEQKARQDLSGYYAHCTALDHSAGEMIEALRATGLEDDTVFLFTSDHGDMLGSQGYLRKQKPWDESIRVPFLLRWPAGLGREGMEIETPVGAPDVMPTLLGLAGVPVPETVEGLDFSNRLRGGATPGDGAALIACYTPFGEWSRDRGGKEYRGLRDVRYTYVRDLDGPWLLYDNEADPYQIENLVGRPDHAERQADLDARLSRKLEDLGDAFRPGEEYVRRWGYVVDEATGTVPYNNKLPDKPK